MAKSQAQFQEIPRSFRKLIAVQAIHTYDALLIVVVLVASAPSRQVALCSEQ
jgi:hypothetical protein